MFIILFYASFIRSEEFSYSEEAYVELDSSQSPAQLTLKGLSIMLVEWSGAIIKIGNKKLSTLDGYSLFTFLGNSEIELTFPKKISFFLIKNPSQSMYPKRFFSNLQTNEIVESNIACDYYFSVYGPYNVQGTIQMTDGSFISSDPDKTIQIKGQQNIDVKDIKYTSSLIRTTSSDSLTLTDFKITTTTKINPTVPTSIKFDKEQHQFANGRAYGGINTIDSQIIDDIDAKSYSYAFKVKKQMTSNIVNNIFYRNLNISNSDYNSLDFDQNNECDMLFVYPCSIGLYYTCDGEYVLFKTVDATSYSDTYAPIPENLTFTITDNDIPDNCKIKMYYINIKNDLSKKIGADLYFAINDEKNPTLMSQGSQRLDYKSNKKPYLDLYITTSSSDCNAYDSNTKIGRYNFEINPVTYTINDNNINTVCLPYLICTNVDDIPSNIIIGYRYAGQSEITEINDQLELQDYEKSFDVEIILIQSAYCNKKNIVLNTISSSKTIKCESTITIDLIPEECRPRDESSIDIPEQVTLSPPVTSKEPVNYTTNDFTTDKNGDLFIEITDDKDEGDVQYNIEVEQGVDSILVDTNEKQISLILPKEIDSITIKAVEGDEKQEFDIIPKADSVTLILDKNTKVSILEATKTVKVSNIGNDESLSMKRISPQSKDFKFVSEVSVDIDEIDFNGNQGMNVETEKEISVKKVKIQSYSSGTINNVAIENIVLAPSSSLSIKSNVNLKGSTIDISFNNKLSSQKAPINGELNSLPKSIILNTRDFQYLANDDSFLLAESESENFQCDEWVKIFNNGQFNTKYNDAKCIKEDNSDGVKVTRLYATVNNNKNKGKDDKGNGLSAGAIAGIVITCIVVVAVIIILVYFLIIKKKRDKSSEQEAVDI